LWVYPLGSLSGYIYPLYNRLKVEQGILVLKVFSLEPVDLAQKTCMIIGRLGYVEYPSNI